MKEWINKCHQKFIIPDQWVVPSPPLFRNDVNFSHKTNVGDDLLISNLSYDQIFVFLAVDEGVEFKLVYW